MRIALPAASLFVVTVGCSGSSSGAPSGTRITELDEANAGKLCDYSADLYGGYGKSKECGGGTTVSGPTSREVCVKDLLGEKGNTSCTATVGDLEAYAASVARCEDGKNLPDDVRARVAACL